MLRAPLLAAAASLALLGAPALADTASQRAVVFQQMLGDPANRGLMRDYARLSVELRDFEAATSTLERLIDLEPDNASARVELAVAYFALGSYAVAEYHLTAAQSSGGLTPEEAAVVARYLDEAQDRGDGSAYSGRVALGYAFTDTADEQGTFLTGNVDWRLDMGGAHASQWVTEFSFSSYNPDDDSINGRTGARLRTGPEFRVAGDAYGPRLQTYLEFGLLDRDPDLDVDFNTVAVGLAYANPVNERVTVYADLALGREYAASDSANPMDFDFHEFDLGMTYRPSRDTRFRLSGSWGARDEIDGGASPDSTTAASLRLSGQHAFDPGFLDISNRWVAGGFLETAQLTFDDGIATDDITRMSYGAFLRAFVYEDIYLEAGAAQQHEETDFSSGLTGEREETVYTFQIGWEF